MSTPNPPRTGKLLIPPNRERPGGFFRNGMPVQVLGPDPEDPSRIIVLLGEGQRKLSFDPKFVVVDRNSRGQKKGTVEEYLGRKLANFVL